MQKETEKKEKILSINILRFMAAIGVMYYHYIFMFTQREYTNYNYGAAWNIFHYGYLGVDLFFIISGFVIAMSAEGRSLFQFLTSRIARLYPIYWASVIITSIFIYFYGSSINAYITLKNFLANLTMQPFSFGGYPIDGSYWSLSVELKFYILIGILLFIGGYKHLEKISITSSLILFIGAISGYINFNWASYFLAGIIFYNIYKDKLNMQRFVAIILLLLSSIIYAVSRVPELTNSYNVNFSSAATSLYIFSFYFIFLFISTKHIDGFLNKITLNKNRVQKLFIILGSLTFPVYLLHQVVGHILIKKLENFNVNVWTSLFFVSIFIFSISYLLNIFVENQGRSTITKYMKLLGDKMSHIKILKPVFSKS